MSRTSTYYQFLPFFILYFFFNNLFLKEGLLYTTLLTPVFLYWLYKNHQLVTVLKWSVLLVIPVPFQLIPGVDPGSYIVSTLMVIAAWILLFTAIRAVRTADDFMEDYFVKALAVNSVLLVLALCIFPFHSLRDFMWDSVPMSRDLAPIPRLKLFAYEPSHYGLLLSPVFMYFILKILTGKTKHPLLLGAGAGLPLLLSFSFGIIGILFVSILIVSIAYFYKFSGYTRKLFIYGLVFTGLIILGLLIFWPTNPVYVRIENIFTGADSSSKGRLVHSFMFAKDLVIQHSAWLGVGPGQVKILAHDLIVNFYKYTGEFAETVRIPNSMGEMLAIYGVFGFVLKIGFEIYFFFRCKIYRNLYSLALFIFIFIYQFTGSFLVNAAEIGTWAIVFNSRFKAFDTELINPDKP